MYPLVEFALTASAFLGHFSIAVWLFNRLHAIAMPRRLLKTLERLLLLVAVGVVVAFSVRWQLAGQGQLFGVSDGPLAGYLWLAYAALAWLAALAVIPCWLIPKLRERRSPALLANDTTFVAVADRLGYDPVAGSQARFFARLPGNELLKIAVQRKTLQLPSLPRELDGLTIAHLSDLHMTGQLTQAFYEVVAAETNALSPDLVLLTGDILEKEECLPWIEPTLGRLQARHGKYFILGNHERRLADPNRLRASLRLAGLTDVGSRCESLLIGSAELLIAGTERPWFGTAPELPAFTAPQPPFRVLLSHTPDQLPWARSCGFDLMLAGHNHGGQIRLPYVGALITPSWYGSRYAGGLYSEPPMLLHVSRGLAGIHPIRLNCPPEIALLELRAA